MTCSPCKLQAKEHEDKAANLEARLAATSDAYIKQLAKHQEEVCNLKLRRDDAYKAMHQAEQRAEELREVTRFPIQPSSSYHHHLLFLTLLLAPSNCTTVQMKMSGLVTCTTALLG